MKDTKHIRRDFHYVVWVMPQGWDFGALGVPRWSKKKKKFKHGQVKFSSEGQAGDLGVRSKVKYH